jgi:hypothetical protein
LRERGPDDIAGQVFHGLFFSGTESSHFLCSVPTLPGRVPSFGGHKRPENRNASRISAN